MEYLLSCEGLALLSLWYFHGKRKVSAPVAPDSDTVAVLADGSLLAVPDSGQIPSGISAVVFLHGDFQIQPSFHICFRSCRLHCSHAPADKILLYHLQEIPLHPFQHWVVSVSAFLTVFLYLPLKGSSAGAHPAFLLGRKLQYSPYITSPARHNGFSCLLSA